MGPGNQRPPLPPARIANSGSNTFVYGKQRSPKTSFSRRNPVSPGNNRGRPAMSGSRGIARTKGGRTGKVKGRFGVGHTTSPKTAWRRFTKTGRRLPGAVKKGDYGRQTSLFTHAASAPYMQLSRGAGMMSPRKRRPRPKEGARGAGTIGMGGM